MGRTEEDFSSSKSPSSNMSASKIRIFSVSFWILIVIFDVCVCQLSTEEISTVESLEETSDDHASTIESNANQEMTEGDVQDLTTHAYNIHVTEEMDEAQRSSNFTGGFNESGNTSEVHASTIESNTNQEMAERDALDITTQPGGFNESENTGFIDDDNDVGNYSLSSNMSTNSWQVDDVAYLKVEATTKAPTTKRIITEQDIANQEFYRSEPMRTHVFGCYAHLDVNMESYHEILQAPANLTDSGVRPPGSSCIEACKQLSGTALMTYAAWLPREPFEPTWRCFCFEQQPLRSFKLLNLADCLDTDIKSGNTLVYSVCPRGWFPPPTCPGRCPVFCPPSPSHGQVELPEPACKASGFCAEWCMLSIRECETINVCEVMSGTQGLSPRPSVTTYITKKAGFYLFPGIASHTYGYITQVSFLIKNFGNATISIWRQTIHEDGHDDFFWILVDKVDVSSYSSADGINVVKIPTEKQFYVLPGDTLGIEAAGEASKGRNDMIFAFVELTDSVIDVGSFKVGTETTGAYAFFDPTSTSDKDHEFRIPNTGLTYSKVGLNLPRLFVDINVTIECSCSWRCDGSECLQFGMCKYGCLPGRYGNDCDSCKRGRYGINCSRECTGCLWKGCHTMTGVCKHGCRPDLRGLLCDTPCPPGQFGHDCLEICSENCINKSCTSAGCECQLGYMRPLCKTPCTPGWYGDCSQECGVCDEGEACNHVTGYCPNNTCAPGYLLPLCNIPCSAGLWGQSCEMHCGQCAIGTICKHTSGECPTGCVKGYQPPMCLEDCHQGYFGEYCESYCDNCRDLNCSGAGMCLSGCADGYIGYNCNTTCVPGLWGENCSQSCSHCFQNSTCDYRTGMCPDSEPLCESGYHNERCSGKCGACGHHTCDAQTGLCPPGPCSNPKLTPPYCSHFNLDGSCFPGFYGKECKKRCGACASRRVCDGVTGHCPVGCLPGVQPPNCHTSCLPGSFGSGCNSSCGNCVVGQVCHYLTGGCGLCQDGYEMPTCISKCSGGTYGEKCMFTCGHCKDGKPCDHLTGYCTEGCAPGYLGYLCGVASQGQQNVDVRARIDNLEEKTREQDVQSSSTINNFKLMSFLLTVGTAWAARSRGLP